MKKIISVDSLNEDISKLQELRACESDPRKLFYIDRIIDSIKQFIYTSRLSETVNQSLKSLVFDMATDVISYQSYYDYLTTLFIELKKYKSSIDEIVSAIATKYKGIDINGLSLSSIVINHGDLINYISNFYRSFDSELFGYFKSIVNNPLNVLHMYDNQSDCFSKELYSGFSFNVNLLNRSYISIYNPGNIDFYSSGVHEFGHSISFLLNPKANMFDGFNPLVEVPSMFPELVSLEDNVNGFNRDDLMLARFRTLYSVYDIVNIMYGQSLATGALVANDFNYNLKYKMDLKKKGIDSKILRNVVDSSLESNGIYALSYAIALELLHSYRSNKEDTLEEFKKLIMFDDPSNVFGYAIDRIGFDKHFNEEVESTLSGMKLVLKNRI